MITIKRVYDKIDRGDGVRILVDRLWPRGLSKEKAKIDVWLKDIAPSDQLRRWFSHKPEKWIEFKKRYFLELNAHGDSLKQIITQAKKVRVTLLYGAKEERFNNAAALKEYLEHERKKHGTDISSV